MDRGGSNSRTAQVTPEGRPLGPGGPHLLLTPLHIVILKQQGDHLDSIIKKEKHKKKGDYKNRNTLKAASIT